MPFDSHIAVKEAVLPFNRFTGVDTVLGPEMKSTGEVMGIDAGFGVAYAKSQAAAYGTLPTKGRVFVSLANRDKRSMVFPVKRLVDLGFEVLATDGTAEMLDRNGVRATVVPKFSEGLPGNAVEWILAGEIDLVINTPWSSSGNAGAAHRRLRDPQRVRRPRGALRDHRAGGRRRRAGDRGGDARRRRGAAAAGVAPAAGRGARDLVARGGRLMPAQVRNASVLQIERLGSYHRMRVVAPDIAAGVRPGHFVAFAVGGPEGGLLLRRAFSVHGTGGGGTVDVIFSVAGAGTRWLAERRPGDRVDVVGPLGHPFPLPTEPARCVLVGGGYGSAPLFMLAGELRKRGCRVDMVLGAATESRLFGALDAKRVSDSAAITTDDGSAGTRGPRHRRARPFRRARRRGVRVRPDADARGGDEAGARARARGARRGRGGDGLRHRRLHDMRAAGARPRRRGADGPVLCGGPGLPG